MMTSVYVPEERSYVQFPDLRVRKLWTEDQMLPAVYDVTSGLRSVRGSAIFHKLPLATLWRRVKMMKAEMHKRSTMEK